MIIYVMGSLRNPRITEVGNALRAVGYEAFEEWHSGGPAADDEWQRYERERGRTYKEALRGYHARNIFEFDLRHMQRAEVGVLVMPAGRSGHLELGWMIGQGKPGYVLFEEEPSRYDVMYNFATDVCFSLKELIDALWLQMQSDVNARPWNADR